MLGLEGKPQEYEQVFGPELGLIKQGDEGVHWSKKPIPQEVYEAAIAEAADFKTSLDLAEYAKGGEVGLAIKLMEADNVVAPDNFKDVLEEKLVKCDERERKNFWAILKYSLKQRHEKRRKDLEKLKQSKKGIEGIASGWVINELEERERKYEG